MYLRILKKDLKRKKTMNVILLIFIILAAMFVASSVNNMITITTALDGYFEMSEVPDYWFSTSFETEAKRFSDFAKDNGYNFKSTKLIQIDPKEIKVNGEDFEYSNSVVISRLNNSKVFDKNGTEITYVNEGEIYVTSEIFNSEKNNFYEGCKVEITSGNSKKEFTLKGFTKDALFGSSMIGMTRFLINDNDFEFFNNDKITSFISFYVYTDDDLFADKLNELNMKLVMNVDRTDIKMMYIMDMLIAAVVLVVSICLILISMVILRFTINFTMSEEFREIGVMKAIGIRNNSIRGIYILKYFVISAVGAVIGFILSFPFGNLMLNEVSKNIIIADKNKFFINLICAVITAVTVVLFCYFCTRKIKNFSPIDAIRNGETGERYSKKSFISLSKSKLKPSAFMAVNDILSELKRYISMILIFTLGILLVIIPVNTINTLQSDKLITLFNMANCDIVISQELLFSSNGKNEAMIKENIENIEKVLEENNIKADVFQEVMSRFNISYGNKKSSSLAFLGVGKVTTDMYSYLEGTAPQNKGEIAISYITADKIGAKIGDEVEIDMGREVKKYIVTAINQSMNNLGEGIRFYQKEDIDYDFVIGSFGVQISYKDNPDNKTFEERKDLLKKIYFDTNVYSAGEYISYMIGDAAGQLQNVKSLILVIIICINILVAVLMVKSFITKEKGEIAMLKAIGFRNSSLMLWQSMRIGIVLIISIIIGTIISTPLSKIIIEPIFKIMGAYSIEFDIIPFEVYIVYPFLVLLATVFAAMLGAMPLRKISASETSKIE